MNAHAVGTLVSFKHSFCLSLASSHPPLIFFISAHKGVSYGSSNVVFVNFLRLVRCTRRQRLMDAMILLPYPCRFITRRYIPALSLTFLNGIHGDLSHLGSLILYR